MDYFLIGNILILLCAILYVWYYTRYANYIPNSQVLELDTEEDKVLSNWYKSSVKEELVDDSTVFSKYLKNIYGIEVNSSLLIIGEDLDEKYFKLTKKELSEEYQPGVDCYFDFRPVIAKTGQVAIINDIRIRQQLERSNTFDLTEIYSIISNGLEIGAYQYLKQVLDFRWEQILKLEDDNVLNREGSYLYYKPSAYIKSSEKILDDQVAVKITSKGARVNLLCSNYEFEALIDRWKKYLSGVIKI